MRCAKSGSVCVLTGAVAGLALMLLCTCTAPSSASFYAEPDSIALSEPPALPSPLSLARVPRAVPPFTYSQPGNGFRTDLPHAGVTPVGASAVFNPADSPEPGGPAFAVYEFSFEGYRPQSVHLNPGRLDIPREAVWIGIANFSSGRWDWYCEGGNVAPDSFQLGECDFYRNEDLLSFVAVVVTGGESMPLHKVSWEWLDEIEHDDLPEQANLLPPKASRTIYAHVGDPGPPPAYAGYDGDDVDYWKLYGFDEQQLVVNIYFESEAGSPILSLRDGLDQELAVFDIAVDSPAEPYLQPQYTLDRVLAANVDLATIMPEGIQFPVYLKIWTPHFHYTYYRLEYELK